MVVIKDITAREILGEMPFERALKEDLEQLSD